MKTSFMTTDSRIAPEMQMPPITQDSFLSGAVFIRQPKDGYRVGTDAVMLAASIHLGKATSHAHAGRMLDMGAGVGGVSLAVMHRLQAGHITAIEKDAVCAELLAQNIAENNREQQIRAVQGDIRTMPAMLAGSFDTVFANPPFHHEQDHHPRSSRRSLAHNGDGATLSDWIASALWATRHKGRITFIVRADRTDEVMAALQQGGAGEVLLFPIWSYSESPAVRMIITARKGVKGAMALLPGIVLHRPSGALTPAAQKIMKGGALNLVHPAATHLR